jgi:PTH1 family peptidyl-tRNA hydrolase
MARTEPRVILICLGNPGPERAGTRHNAAYMLGDYLHDRHEFGPFEPLAGAECLIAEGSAAGLPVLLVRPTTSLNDCGRMMPPLLDAYPFDDHLYGVAHDDLDVPVGTVRGRQKGGHGGHNGVRAVLDAAGRKDLFRIKIGIGSGRREEYASIVDFLLSDFQDDERQMLESSFPEAEEILLGQIGMFAAGLSGRDRRQETAQRYVAEVLEDARTVLQDLPAVSAYPVLLRRSEVDRARDVVIALAKLLRKAKRAAGEEEALYAYLSGFIPEDLRPLLPPRSSSQDVFFAADLHVDGGRMKVIELNCAVGYAHYARLADELLFPLLQERLGSVTRPSEADFASFLYQHGLKPLHDPDAGEIVFLRGLNNEDMFNVDELESLAARMREQGAPRITLCHERDLTLQPDGLWLGDGRRVDVVYVEENLADWAEMSDLSPLVQAVRRQTVKTFPTPDTFLYTNKAFLSLLGDPSSEPWLQPDDREQQVIRTNLLWSHVLDADIEPAAYYMLEQGLRLVVKDTLGGGGRGVTVLRPESGSQQAGHILRRRMLDGDSVVQGYFEAGRWSEDSDLRFDLRILAAAHEGDVAIGPIYARVFRGTKLSFSDPDAGVAPVYVVD